MWNRFRYAYAYFETRRCYYATRRILLPCGRGNYHSADYFSAVRMPAEKPFRRRIFQLLCP
jgi:hypothetical protein